MIANAMNYQDELRKAFYAIWYEPKYQYYFNSYWRWPFRIDDSGDALSRRDFVSLDMDGNLLGHIGYTIDPDIKLAYRFGVVNFSTDKLTFGRDICTVVDDVFIKFGIETLEFEVVIGNPVERSYDKIVHRIGGRALCTRHARARDMAGNICDDKIYEITKEEYLHFCNRKKNEYEARTKTR